MARQPQNRRQRRRAEKLNKQAMARQSHQVCRKQHDPVWQRAGRQLEPVQRYWQTFWQNRSTIITPLILFLMIVGTIYRIATS